MGNSEKGSAMDNNRFVSDRKIERYRRLACAAVTGHERTELLGLLADEEDKHIDSILTPGESNDSANATARGTRRSYDAGVDQ
jgi:hypothetical protein